VDWQRFEALVVGLVDREPSVQTSASWCGPVAPLVATTVNLREVVLQDVLGHWLSDPLLSRIVGSVLAIIVIMMVVRLVNRWLARFIREGDVRYRTRKVVTFLGYIAALVVVGAVFSNQLGTFAVAFGVAGAGIAFALQEVIASCAGWVAIVFGYFFRVGDRVQLGGIKGDVIDVGVLRTTLMECGQWVNGDLYNGRIVRVANSFVFKEPVFNYSADFPFLWDEITVPVRYGSDYDYARSIIQRVLDDVVGDYARGAKVSWRNVVERYRIEDASVDPMVALVANDNWVQFTARYVVDYRQRRTTKDRVFARLLQEIAATKGRVTLGSNTYEIVGVPPLEVRLTPPDAARPSSPEPHPASARSES
jgi:small-conductance mechanosensitive channel